MGKEWRVPWLTAEATIAMLELGQAGRIEQTRWRMLASSAMMRVGARPSAR